jgi:hypothetical protein
MTASKMKKIIYDVKMAFRKVRVDCEDRRLMELAQDRVQ